MNETALPVTQPQDRPVTLQRVAQLLGCSIATVSRLRAGDRQPSFLLMAGIERAIGWMIEDQARARAGSRWHLEFETQLHRYFNRLDGGKRHG